MTAAQDAAVQYFALHGTDAPLTCQHWIDTVDDKPTVDRNGKNLGRLKGSDQCGATLVGLAHDDGCPLCAEHVKSEGGHLLSEEVLAELWVVKRTLKAIELTPELPGPRSNLETFALKVAGIDPTADTERPPPDNSGVPIQHSDWRDPPARPFGRSRKHTDEARVRGHRR